MFKNTITDELHIPKIYTIRSPDLLPEEAEAGDIFHSYPDGRLYFLADDGRVIEVADNLPRFEDNAMLENMWCNQYDWIGGTEKLYNEYDVQFYHDTEDVDIPIDEFMRVLHA